MMLGGPETTVPLDASSQDRVLAQQNASPSRQARDGAAAAASASASTIFMPKVSLSAPDQAPRGALSVYLSWLHVFSSLGSPRLSPTSRTAPAPADGAAHQQHRRQPSPAPPRRLPLRSCRF